MVNVPDLVPLTDTRRTVPLDTVRVPGLAVADDEEDVTAGDVAADDDDGPGAFEAVAPAPGAADLAGAPDTAAPADLAEEGGSPLPRLAVGPS